jgi:GH25 family lysozyme M1 (1,4-beta-N-acetylmuramidase)
MDLKGIDVSSNNGQPNWDEIKKAGIQFAMIRLGYGSDLINQDDKEFQRNVSECERIGIPWGAYLYSYALNENDAKSELNHIRRVLNGKRPVYPICLDMEDADGYKKKNGMPNNATLVNICDIILSGLQQDGFYSMLYASKDWLENQLNDSKLDKYNKWVAQWASNCTYQKPFGIWQYTNSLDIGGAKFDSNITKIDFGNFYGQKAQKEMIPSEWAKDAWGWGLKQGLITKDSKPRDLVTHEDMVNMLYWEWKTRGV